MKAPTKAGATKTMAFGKVGEFLVAVHTNGPPNELEWSSWVEFSFRNVAPGGTFRILVVTEGGAPSPAQRQSMNDRFAPYLLENPKALRTAIVTGSALVRGVVTALSWFHPGHCAFSPARLDDAMAYLDVPPEQRPEMHSLLKTLQAQLASSTDGVRRISEKR